MLALQSTYIGFLNDENWAGTVHNLFTYDKFSSHFYVFFSFDFDSVLIFINYDA